MRSLCGVVVWEHARRLNVEREKQRKSGDSEFEMNLDIWRASGPLGDMFANGFAIRSQTVRNPNPP